jgi:hypothetical protein
MNYLRNWSRAASEGGAIVHNLLVAAIVLLNVVSLPKLLPERDLLRAARH